MSVDGSMWHFEVKKIRIKGPKRRRGGGTFSDGCRALDLHQVQLSYLKVVPI